MSRKISDTGNDYLARVSVLGREISRGVAKRKHGGALEAYQRALAIQTELERQYQVPHKPLPRLRFLQSRKPSYKYGWAGISRRIHYGRNGWVGIGLQVAYLNEFGERSNASFYEHQYHSPEEMQRAAVVFRVQWELDELTRYEEDVRQLFAEYEFEPWPELLATIAELRAEREAVLASGPKPQPLEQDTAKRETIRPVTIRLDRPETADLGLLPDEDFILEL
jgi:hypothetical protein